MQVQPYNGLEMRFDRSLLEDLLLQLGDVFEIRIVWNRDTAVITGVLAIAGGLLGGYAGGRVGAAVGAGIAGAAGLGVATIVSLREIWNTIKTQLNELMYIIFNYLRRLDPIDYVRAIQVLIACAKSRRELVLTIVEFIAQKLGTEVLSRFSARSLEY